MLTISTLSLRRSTLLQRSVLLLTACFIWSFALAPCALGATAAKKSSPTATGDRSIPHLPVSHLPSHLTPVLPHMAKMPPQMLRPNLVPLPEGARQPAPTAALATMPTTLLGQVAHLARPVSPAEAASWTRELRTHPSAARAAALHLWLGEWQLAANEEPVTADQHFAQARHLARVAGDRSLFGLAQYDGALALFYEGAFADSAIAFRSLIASSSLGYDRRLAAMWSRHAAACAGYHAQRAAAGIPEPPRLDPLCGVAGLAVCLRTLHLPYAEKTVRRACRTTGEGSNLKDILKAAKPLGVTAHAVTADDTGLMALPKPLIATAEHDHFVAVVGADKSGVTYICSDCGPWPGGGVHLTWRQWHLLEPTFYVTVTRPGSADDRLMTSVLAKTPPTPARLAFSGSLGRLHLGAKLNFLQSATLLRRHVVLTQNTPSATAYCGTKPNAPACPPQVQCCPCGGGPNGGPDDGPFHFDPFHPLYMGPTAGDPVNPATLEEQYEPSPDLTVYNPVGPSVSWARQYRSMRGPGRDVSELVDPYYQNDDFGVGWTQNYNVGVTNPNAYAPPFNDTSPQYTAGTTVSITLPTPIYANPPTWPDTAGTWRIYSNTTGAQIATNDTTPPDDDEDWDRSGSPNGWNMTYSGSHHFTLTIPANAASGSFEWFYQTGSTNTAYEVQNFSVEPSGPTTGAKAIVFPNGSQITFNAPAIPSSTAASAPTTTSSTRVACTVQAGAPYLVEWDYDASTPWGHFVITMANRTKWVTTTATATDCQYYLGQIVDRNGNAITFHYGSTATVYNSTHWKLLSSITNAASTTLLTINRATDGTGNITSITDCYGRSVYYHEGAYATANVPYPYSQSYQEVDHVSQVVATGTTTPPDRWALGYQNVSNHVSSETVPFLHTITVPSPTGTGSQSAYINYDSATDLVSSLVDANGNTITFTSCNASGAASYPSNYSKAVYTDSLGNQVYSKIIGFDSNMSESSVTDGKGNVVMSKTFADPNDPYRPSSVTDGNGKTTSGTWDSYGNLLTVTPPSNGTRTPAVTTNTYSYTKFALGELIQMQTGSKGATTFIYDDQAVTGGYLGSGLLLSVTTPKPGTTGGATTATTAYTYDLTTYNSSGGVTYQGLGNLLSVTKPGNDIVSTITTTLGYTTDGTYSQSAAIGQPLTATDNLGKVTHFRYDSRANMTATMDALGNETDATYSITDQPLQTTLPATGQQGSGHSYVLNAYLYPGGPRTSATTYDESGTIIRQTTYVYGKEGETLGVAGSTEPATYTYDAYYRVASLTDGGGHITHYYYKAQGYLDAMTYPGYTGPAPVYSSGSDGYTNITGADSVRYPTYDTNGNVLTRVDGRGVTTTYTHSVDPESLLTLTHYAYPGGYAGGTTGDVSYAYDAYGRRSSMTDGTGGQTDTYDDLDKPLSVVTTYTGLTAKTFSYGYYADGSRYTMSTPAGTFVYHYDGDGRMKGQTNPWGEVTSWLYLDNGWLSKQVLNNGMLAAYTYNALGEATELANRVSGGSTFSDFYQQKYDGAGNRTRMTASLPGAPTSYTGLTTYTYDGGLSVLRGQLTQETSARNGGYTNTFAYDGGSGTGPGNPTTFRGTSHSYNANNQDTASTYDGNGNPTSYGGNALTFDPENRMTSAGSVLTAGYTGDGLRAWKQGSAGKIYFLYDGNQSVIELNSAGSLSAINTFGADGLLYRRNYSGGTTTYYMFDSSGNVAQRLTSTQGIISSDMYDGYGARQSTGSADVFGFGAQWGYYTDSETGFVLCTHRYYDPSAGRWLTRDPIGHEGGINLYGYCQNSPITRMDASGHDWKWSYDGLSGDPLPKCSCPNPFDTRNHNIGAMIGGAIGSGFGGLLGFLGGTAVTANPIGGIVGGAIGGGWGGAIGAAIGGGLADLWFDPAFDDPSISDDCKVYWEGQMEDDDMFYYGVGGAIAGGIGGSAPIIAKAFL